MNKKNEFINKKSLHTAALILENGQIFWGKGLGPKKTAIAELCFNTSITGYQEVITDPSYAKQIITFTFPHIGIVGTNENDNESSKVYASGCIISQDLSMQSNWRSKKSLSDWFVNKNIPCITNIDTRQITRILTTEGALKAALVNYGNENIDLENIKKDLKNWQGLKNLDLSEFVTTKKPYKFNESIWNPSINKYNSKKLNDNDFKIVCIDYGAKKNIFRSLTKKNLNVTVVPSNYSFEEIMSYNPVGIFLSNGPGDPYATGKYAIPIIKKFIELKIPIFGICLGHQILSLALGGKTKKMYQGHRGSNHPVKNLKTKKVEITCQNHGFEVLSNSLPSNVIQTHISLFDKTNEGIKHKFLPIFSVQYHPESSPGPHDSKYLFDLFYKNIKKYAKKK